MHGTGAQLRRVEGALFGNRTYELRRPLLDRWETAWILQVPAARVKRLFERGERLRERGLSDTEILQRGALPTAYAGTDRRIGCFVLAQHPRVRDDPITNAALGALVSGELRAPRASKASEQPPRLLAELPAL